METKIQIFSKHFLNMVLIGLDIGGGTEDEKQNIFQQIFFNQIYLYLRSLAKYARTKCRSKLRKWEVQV